jgi:hypothetical protein
MNDELLTGKQAAELLGVGWSTFRWIVANGTLAPLRLKTERTPERPRVFYRRGDVKALTDGRWRRTRPRGEGRIARKKAREQADTAQE